MLEIMQNSILDFIIALIFSILLQLTNFKNKKISANKFVLFFIIIYVCSFMSRFIPIPWRIIFIIASYIIPVMIFYEFDTRFWHNVLDSILNIVSSYLIIVIGDILSSLIFAAFGISDKQAKTNFSLLIIVHLIIIITATIAVLLKFLYLQRKNSKGSIKTIKLFSTKPIIFMTMYAVFTIAMLFINGIIYKVTVTGSNSISDKLIILCISLFIIYLVVNTIVIILYMNSKNQQSALDFQAKEYEHLRLYTNIIEDLVKGFRKQRHDYANVLLSLKGYLDNNDLETTRSYYYQILSEQEQINIDKEIYTPLQYIKKSGLKGLISSKITLASQKGIHVTVAIFEEVEKFHIEEIDLCKIIGILIDNAIEAAVDTEDKKVIIELSKSNEGIYILIGNTFKEKPNLSEIFKHGYSTKGQNRGIGLNTVKEIIDTKYKNILLNTYINNNIFVQELDITE